MKKILSDWFTGPDNDNFEAARFLWFVSVLAGIGYAGGHLIFNGEFNIIEFGTGMGALLALGGGGVAVKDYGALKGRNTLKTETVETLNVNAEETKSDFTPRPGGLFK